MGNSICLWSLQFFLKWQQETRTTTAIFPSQAKHLFQDAIKPAAPAEALLLAAPTEGATSCEASGKLEATDQLNYRQSKIHKLAAWFPAKFPSEQIFTILGPKSGETRSKLHLCAKFDSFFRRIIDTTHHCTAGWVCCCWKLWREK